MIFKIVGILPVIVGSLMGQLRLDFADLPPPSFPPFPGFMRQMAIQGEMTVIMTFQGRKVASIELEESRFEALGRVTVPPGLESSVFRVISDRLNSWSLLTTDSRPPLTVTIVFKLDREFFSRTRSFSIVYDEYGLPTHVEITAPFPDPELH